MSQIEISKTQIAHEESDGESAMDCDETNEQTEKNQHDAAEDTGGEDKQKTKELTWPKSWPKNWPKLDMQLFEERITTFKKAHKNALPTAKQLPLVAFGEKGKEYVTDDEKEEDLFKTLLGEKNKDTNKLDQAGQKNSMRAKYKETIAVKGPPRDPAATDFKLFALKVFLTEVPDVVPGLERYVTRLTEHAASIDKGHQPTALLKKAKDELTRAKDARDARKARVEEAQRKRRKAAVGKKQSAHPEIDEEVEARLRSRSAAFVMSLLQHTPNLPLKDALAEAEKLVPAWREETLAMVAKAAKNAEDAEPAEACKIK
jgi:hypothetical protein